MALYESVFIARQDVSAPQVEAIADGFATLLEEHGGKVAKREHWGLKNLNYRIKKNRKGHYVLFNIDAPSEAVQEMERQMRLHEDILRYLTLRLDELDEEPSVQMQNRSRDRDESPRRRDDEERKPREDSPAPAAAPAAAAAPADDAEPAAAEDAVETPKEGDDA